MAPTKRSTSAPARKAAEAKDATAILATSQAHDSNSGEVPDRPTKRPCITREIKTKDRKTGADASRQAVFQTSELLEGILAFLPPKQLFVDRRICKQWRDVIASSPELQRKMFLRVDEVPRQTWGSKVEYFEDSDPSVDLLRCDSRPLSWEWRRVTPVMLNPHMKITSDGCGYDDSVAFEPPRGLPIGSHSSILDTYISNPPCYDFGLYLDFKFEPAIPNYYLLSVSAIHFQSGMALKVGEALDRAMAVRTNASLHKNYRDKSVETKIFRNITPNEIINKLQHEYKCTTILCRSSFVTLDDVVVPSEQQWAEVNAAYAKTIQRTD